MKVENCDKFLDILSIEEGERTSEQREFIEKHLKVCPDCNELYEQFTSFEETAKNSLTAEVGADFTEIVMNKLKPRIAKKRELLKDEGFLSYIFSSADRAIATVGGTIAGVISIILLLIYKPTFTIGVDFSFINRYSGRIFNYIYTYTSMLVPDNLILYPIIGLTILAGSLIFTMKNDIVRGLYRLI